MIGYHARYVPRCHRDVRRRRDDVVVRNVPKVIKYNQNLRFKFCLIVVSEADERQPQVVTPISGVVVICFHYYECLSL